MPDLTTTLEKLLNSKVNIDGKNKNIFTELIKVLIVKALKGDTRAINMILERIAGKEVQPIEVSGKGGQGIKIDAASTLSEIDRRLSEIIESGEGNLSKAQTKD